MKYRLGKILRLIIGESSLDRVENIENMMSFILKGMSNITGISVDKGTIFPGCRDMYLSKSPIKSFDTLQADIDPTPYGLISLVKDHPNYPNDWIISSLNYKQDEKLDGFDVINRLERYPEQIKVIFTSEFDRNKYGKKFENCATLDYLIVPNDLSKDKSESLGETIAKHYQGDK